MAIQLGGKDAASRKRAQGKMPPMLVIGIHPAAVKNSGPKSPNDPEELAEGESNAPVRPGESMFHDQTETCATCEYFDAKGTKGVGACLKHVPEADFSIADPGASWCKFHEDAKDEGEGEKETE